jgi:hypothetical protein
MKTLMGSVIFNPHSVSAANTNMNILPNTTNQSGIIPFNKNNLGKFMVQKIAPARAGCKSCGH